MLQTHGAQGRSGLTSVIEGSPGFLRVVARGHLPAPAQLAASGRRASKTPPWLPTGFWRRTIFEASLPEGKAAKRLPSRSLTLAEVPCATSLVLPFYAATIFFLATRPSGATSPCGARR